MSALGGRRRRGLAVGAAGIALGLLVTVAVALIGVRTLATSRAGQAVSSNVNYQATFPYTPTGLIGVLDEGGSLASLAVVVVDPSGAGGSIIVVASMADGASGTGDVFDPLDRVLAVDGMEAFADQAELMTRLSFDVIEVMMPERFEALIKPSAPFDINLPISVHDAASEKRWERGPVEADAAEATAILTASDPEIDDTYYLPARGAVWAAIADRGGESSGDTAAEVPLTTPKSMDVLWAHLMAGPIVERPMIPHKVPASNAAQRLNPAYFDPAESSPVVVHDRAETVAIFAAIAPGRIGAPNAAARLRIIDPFTAEQVAAVGDGWDLPTMWKQVVDGLLFSGTNVISISEQPDLDVPPVTQVQVADGVVNDEDRDTLTVIFGSFEVVPLTERIEGIDATVVLGQSYLDRLKSASLPTPPVATETLDSSSDSATESSTTDGSSTDSTTDSSADSATDDPSADSSADSPSDGDDSSDVTPAGTWSDTADASSETGSETSP